MKKTYVKPQIAYESFQLSTSIAAGCQHEFVLPATEYVCPVEDPDTGWLLYAESATSPCDTAAGGEKFCYHVSEQNWTVLSS